MAIFFVRNPRQILATALLIFGCTAAWSQVEAPAQPERAPVAHTPEAQIAALRPMLIGKPYLDQARRKLATQLARMSRDVDRPADWMMDNALVVRDFAGDVQIIYSVDLAEGAQLVTWGMIKAWGMDPDRLHQRALANLAAGSDAIHYKQVGKLPWLYVVDVAGDAKDGDAASRVLLHWRWSELSQNFGDALVLGMPTRDVVVFTASLAPDKIAQLRETVATIEAHQGQPVSHKLFLWTPQGWREYE